MGSGDLVGPCSWPRPEPVGLRPEPVSLRPELVDMCPEPVEGRTSAVATSAGRKTPRNSRNVMTRALPFCCSVALSEQGADKSARLNSDPRDPPS
jgi:hypothetical protein